MAEATNAVTAPRCFLLRIACDDLPRIQQSLAVTCGGFGRSQEHLFRTISVRQESFTFSKAKLLILLALPRGLEPLFLP